WEAHVALMTRSDRLTEEDLQSVADEFGLREDEESRERATARVETDEASARASGVTLSPTFFINGRRYTGPWDEDAFTDALLGSLGHRVRTAALDFAGWAPSAGVLLLLASVLAVGLANSPWGEAFMAFWQRQAGLVVGDAGFRLPLVNWINEGWLTVFFLVVGLEIKREFTVGRLSSRRSAALPVAAAIGGMVAPALLYVLVIPDGPWAQGWGVPMATDTAFAIALIAMLGERVPVELRVFLTAATIVDDIGAIIVVALFYSGELDTNWLLGAAAVTAALAMLNSSHVYRASPYLALGVVLWFCVHAGGVHATLAGIILALFIPTRPPPDYRALTMQADAILSTEVHSGREPYRRGLSEPAMHALDDIHNRLESPAARMLRHAGPRSSYIVLPVFAFANAGVVLGADIFDGREALLYAILCGLVIGKPLGMLMFSWLAVRMRFAEKPDAYSWQQLGGAGALSGIGFTMSLFIAGQAFQDGADFAAAKIAVFAASLLSAVIGTALLWHAGRAREQDEDQSSSGT
ncbi:MAG TPA: Na+/H+ antiporter NhaA, partial [Gammaproteobacteria bacterium]